MIPADAIDVDAISALRREVFRVCSGQTNVTVFGVVLDMVCRAAIELKIDEQLPDVVLKRILQIKHEIAKRDAGIVTPGPDDQGAAS